MKNTLTRKELIDAKYAFSCKDWVNNIQKILDSSDDETIEIEDKYLELIKEEAIWEQITFCKDLNLDLKMNLPEEAKEWVLEKIMVCEVVKYGQFETLYKENGKILFLLNSKSKEFWFDYYEVYEVLEDKYSLKFNEINELISNILEDHLKLKQYTPLSRWICSRC